MPSAKPILFSSAMVRAILDKRKTQTRRVVKPQPTQKPNGGFHWGDRHGKVIPCGPRFCGGGSKVSLTELIGEYCPYGGPGDLLWVREIHRFGTSESGRYVIEYQAGPVAAYVDCRKMKLLGGYNGGIKAGKWRPSIHLPRWASRLMLRITEVRVERLQDISEVDCYSEGVTDDWPISGMPYLSGYGGRAVMNNYASLWNSINGKQHPWATNPWLWAISFIRSMPESADNLEWCQVIGKREVS